MLVALRKNARTTPAVCAEIAASNEPASVLTQRFGITEQTVYKWKQRSVFGDSSHASLSSADGAHASTKNCAGSPAVYLDAAAG